LFSSEIRLADGEICGANLIHGLGGRSLYAAPYQHDNFAGGLEDTIVHALLACILWRERSRASMYYDTHAAAGLYLVSKMRSRPRDALKRSSQKIYCARILPQQPLALLQRHLKHWNMGAPEMNVFPGSPALAYSMLGNRVRTLLCERNEHTWRRLVRNSWRFGGVSARCGNGFDLVAEVAAGANKGARQVIFVDPAYEETENVVSDYDRLSDAIRAMQKNGMVALAGTYPAANQRDHERISRVVAVAKNEGANLSYAELTYIQRARELRGAGMILINGRNDFRRDAATVLRQIERAIQLKGARIRVG
jgi:23S rRNA A2030 N6-methylase RlmJ